MVWVHVYVALLSGYSLRLAASLIGALFGVYLLSRPDVEFNLGDALVFIATFMWAAQVLIVDRFSRSDPLVFTAFQVAPGVLFIVPDYLEGGINAPSVKTAALLLYLAVGPGAAAFALQVYGQRTVNPAAATVIYQLEPIFAAAISAVTLGERLDLTQTLGAALIVGSAATASLSPQKHASNPNISATHFIRADRLKWAGASL